MTAVSPLDFLTKPELLHLLKRLRSVDDRDIAACKWEMAEDDRKRLVAEADRLAALETDAMMAAEAKPESGSRQAASLIAQMAALKARTAADRATRKEQARLKELEKFYLTGAKK